MKHQGEVTTDYNEIQDLLTADAKFESAARQNASETSQFQDIVDLIRGVDGQHEEDIATALLTKYKMEAI